ncbi:FAD-dependent monooxygenase [bacterium]|nr:FAD-dependent monooxygenase [bacterium]
MSQLFEVIVVGGGVVGLSAAIAMKQRGFSVAVLDAGPLLVGRVTSDPRVYALNQASQCLLNDLGVWSILDKTRLSPYSHMHVWDAKNAAKIDFDARMVGCDQLGVILEESVIKQALLQQAEALGVVIFSNTRVCRVLSSNEDIRVFDTNNLSFQARLLIVADGAASVTRQCLDVTMTRWPYHQQAIVATVHTEKSHQKTAYQVFNPEGPLAFLPLSDEHQCSIVWSTSPLRAKELMALSGKDFSHQLANAFAKKLGEIKLLSKRYDFTLSMQHAKQYCGPHWLLMGDAAHTIHPLAGLGLNVGLADLATWIAEMDVAKNSIESNKVLGAYQRQRKYAVWQTIVLMGGLKTLFANPFPPVVALRGLGLSVCDRISPLKRLFIEHAAGL